MRKTLYPNAPLRLPLRLRTPSPTVGHHVALCGAILGAAYTPPTTDKAPPENPETEGPAGALKFDATSERYDFGTAEKVRRWVTKYDTVKNQWVRELKEVEAPPFRHDAEKETAFANNIRKKIDDYCKLHPEWTPEKLIGFMDGKNHGDGANVRGLYYNGTFPLTAGGYHSISGVLPLYFPRPPEAPI